jgi:small subunit ribosomal protein S20
LPTQPSRKKNKSAIKRARQAEKRTLRNRAVKSKLKTLFRNVETEVSNKNLEGAKAALNTAIKNIDKAVSKGIIHRNTASRKVSRLTKLVNSLLQSGAA